MYICGITGVASYAAGLEKVSIELDTQMRKALTNIDDRFLLPTVTHVGMDPAEY